MPRKHRQRKEPPLSRGLSRVARPFSLGLVQQQILAALASLRGISPEINSLGDYFFFFLAAFFFAILLFLIGLDLWAFFLARFFIIPGIGTSSS
jgi:hypothetical protein